MVTSDVYESDFRGMSRQDALRRLTEHQRVVETVMRDYPVLPVKFGTILPSPARLQDLLAQGAGMFGAALERFADKLQVEVVMLWDLPRVFAAIAGTPEIAALKAQIGDRPADQTMAERVALGQAVQAALRQGRGALGKQAIDMLQDLALDMVVNPIMDDAMVVNLALLVSEHRRRDLDERLTRLDQALGGQYQIRCVGPLPPYSFATVEVQTFAYEEVEAARRALGLYATTTVAEIKRAYRLLAASAHPDHNPGDAEAEQRMAELTRAYKLLGGYAASQSHGETDWPCPISRDTVEEALLIAISGHDTAGEPAL